MKFMVEKSTVIVEPSGALRPKYDERGFRVSPDIQRYKVGDVWYNADGTRDESRSPKKEIEVILPK